MLAKKLLVEIAETVVRMKCFVAVAVVIVFSAAAAAAGPQLVVYSYIAETFIKPLAAINSLHSFQATG